MSAVTGPGCLERPADDALVAHPFDHYQRFQPIREVLDAYRTHLGVTRLTVLDVGGADGHLAHFLPQDRVHVLDPGGRAPEGVVARGEALPFPDAAFDVVTSVDTLEHVPSAIRASFLRESCRVARDLVVIAAPFHAADVEAAEDFVEQAHRAIYGRADDWLLEHEKNGLPSLPRTLETLGGSHPQTRVVPNGYLPYWRWTMALNYALLAIPEAHDIYRSVNRLVNQRYYPLSHREPSYRKLLLALRGDEGWLDAALGRMLSPSSAVGAGTDGLEATTLGLVSKGIAASVTQKLALVQELEGHTEHQIQELAAMKAQLEWAERYAQHVKEQQVLACAQMEQLQAYVRSMEEEFQKAAALVNEWGIQKELARQHAARLEERLDRVEADLEARNREIQDLRRGWSMRRTLRRLTGEAS